MLESHPSVKTHLLQQVGQGIGRLEEQAPVAAPSRVFLSYPYS